MIRKITLLLLALAVHPSANAQNMFLTMDQDDFIVTNVFSDVDTFAFDIRFAVPLASGSFVNPDITSVTYSVSGTLVPGTPSGISRIRAATNHERRTNSMPRAAPSVLKSRRARYFPTAYKSTNWSVTGSSLLLTAKKLTTDAFTRRCLSSTLMVPA